LSASSRTLDSGCRILDTRPFMQSNRFLALQSDDQALRFLAICQGCADAREGLLFLWRHVRPDICPSVWHGSTVRFSLAPNATLTMDPDMFTSPTRSKVPIYCPFGFTAIRSEPGIISCSIYATTSTSSTSSLSGFCHPTLLCLLRAIVYHMGHSQALSSHGAIVSFSTIRRK
jgi:hypothetical protein